MHRGSWQQPEEHADRFVEAEEKLGLSLEQEKERKKKKSARKAEYFRLPALGYAGARMAVLTADGEEGRFVLTQVNSGLKNTPLWWEMGLIPCGCQCLSESVLQQLLFPGKTPGSKKLYWSSLKSH